MSGIDIFLLIAFTLISLPLFLALGTLLVWLVIGILAAVIFGVLRILE